MSWCELHTSWCELIISCCKYGISWCELYVSWCHHVIYNFHHDVWSSHHNIPYLQHDVLNSHHNIKCSHHDIYMYNHLIKIHTDGKFSIHPLVPSPKIPLRIDAWTLKFYICLNRNGCRKSNLYLSCSYNDLLIQLRGLVSEVCHFAKTRKNSNQCTFLYSSQVRAVERSI